MCHKRVAFFVYNLIKNMALPYYEPFGAVIVPLGLFGSVILATLFLLPYNQIQINPKMNNQISPLLTEDAIPFIGIRCLDNKQAKQFLNKVAGVINDTLDDSCRVSNLQTNSKTDCLFEYANGARVRILVELPELNHREEAV